MKNPLITNRINIISLAFILIFLSGKSVGNSMLPDESATAPERDLDHELCKQSPIVEESKKFGKYEIRLSSAGEQYCHLLEIFENETPIYRDAKIGGYFYFGNDDQPKIEPFSYITSSHDPNLIISTWSGGAHCCYSLLIFELGDQFKKVAEIEGGNFLPLLEDVDHDGTPEIRISDDFLAYQFSCFADSATADVILKYSGDHFRVAAEYMKKSTPDLNFLEIKIALWRRNFEDHTYYGDAPPSLIQTMTDLIFSGHRELALDLVDRSWPVNVSGKREFLASYEKLLFESQYYIQFQEQL